METELSLHYYQINGKSARRNLLLASDPVLTDFYAKQYSPRIK